MTRAERAVREWITRNVAEYKVVRYRAGSYECPVASVRGQVRAAKRLEELEQSLTPREKSWGLEYFLIRQ